MEGITATPITIQSVIAPLLALSHRTTGYRSLPFRAKVRGKEYIWDRRNPRRRIWTSISVWWPQDVKTSAHLAMAALADAGFTVLDYQVVERVLNPSPRSVITVGYTFTVVRP